MEDALQLFTFPDTEALARRVAGRLRLELRTLEVHAFPDGETLIRAEASGPGSALLFRSLDHPNPKLVELLLAADALRRQGVRRIGLVAPYLCYMRQDRVFEPGQSLSQHTIAQLLGTYFEDVLTIEAHLHRIRALSEVFPCRASSISAAPAVADWLRTHPEPAVILGPDAESEPWVREIAERAGLEWRVAAKRRHGDRAVRIDLPPLPRDTRRVLIVDDIGSSGATLASLAEILHQRGVTRIGAIVVHPLFEQGALARLEASGIHPVVSCDGVPHATNAIALAPLLAETIEARWLPRKVA